MIQPLRRAHRTVFFGLAVALPVLLVAGLAARRPLISVEPTSDRINLLRSSGTEMVVDSRELWGNEVDGPDLLVYWVPDDSAMNVLPAEARLLGSLNAARRGTLKVPGEGRQQGYLILYSLAYQKPVAHAPIPKEMP